MNIFNFRGKKTNTKMETTPDKLINSEVSKVSSVSPMPRFNRHIAVNSYNGYWAAAIDYNASKAASGVIRLYSKTSKNGQKCLYPTVKHPNLYQRKFLSGELDHKPSAEVTYKMLEANSEFEIVQGHPIYDLFLRANPFQSTYQLFLEIYLQLEITGDAFVHVVSNEDGTPAQLYVLKSQHMEIVPGKKGSGQYISKYTYNRDQGTPVDFDADEIIHIKYPNPMSMWYGMGKIEKGWQTYLINKFSHEYQVALYKNHAVPDYLLINKSGTSISGNRFFKKMQSLYRGAHNRGKVMAVDGDIDIKTVAFKPKDLSDVTLTIQEIASISGCPINKLIGNDNIKANSESQNIAWLDGTIHPMQKLVASALSEQLLKRYGIEDGDAFLAYDSPLPEDRDYKLKSDETYSRIGVFTINEIRASLGRDLLDVPEANEIFYRGQKLGSKDEILPAPKKEISSDSSEIKEKIDSLVKEISSISAKKEEIQPFSININSSIVEEKEEAKEVDITSEEIL